MRALNPVRCGFKLDPDTITNYIGRLDGSKIANLKTEDNALSVSLSVLSAHTHTPGTHIRHTHDKQKLYTHVARRARRGPGLRRQRLRLLAASLANAIGPGRQWQWESRESGGGRGGRGSGDGVRYR